MEIPNFETAIEEGKVINKDGYHVPNSQGRHTPNCGCIKTTKKGTYRDISVDMGDKIIHYYHQTPVVATNDEKVWLNNGGYKTSTTKERINRYSPYRVIQRDFEWYVKKDGERIDFVNRMELEK